ncbi:MAG: carboxypeptidase-like regulatory domain-containing protein [Salinivirgaceae bacterium]
MKILFFPARLIATIILLMFFSQLLFAAPHPNEKVWVHLNKKVLITGSLLNYKVYLTTSQPMDNKKTVVYFELVNSKNKTLLNWKSWATNKGLAGTYRIPENLTPGIYTLKIFTNTSRKNSFVTKLLIQDIASDPISNFTTSKTNRSFDASAAEKKLFKLWIDNDSLQQTTHVKIESKSNINLPSLTVSITEITPFDSLLDVTTSITETNQTPEKYIPERDFSLVTGKVSDTLGNPIKNHTVYASLSSKWVHFRYATTDSLGRFWFVFDSTYNNRQVLIQAEPVKNQAAVLTLDKKSINLAQADTDSLPANTAQINYTLALQKRELVQRIFTPLNQIKPIEKPDSANENFFHRPRYSIFPNEYELLNNFIEIAENIVPTLRFKKTNNSYELGMVLDNQQVYYNQVLVCVNGHPFFNLHALAELSSKNIERIDVFNAITLWGENTYHGILAIYTNKVDASFENLNTAFAVFDNSFYESRFLPANQNNTTSPLVLPDIYWNDAVILNKNKPFEIKLNKIDIGKNYRLRITGISNETLIDEQFLLELN